MAAGAFNGKITYTTTKDINSIIVTGIPIKDKTTNSATKNIAGNVTIKTGTVTDGKCTECIQTFTPPATTLEITGAKATITPHKDGKATLEIDIKITATAANDKLDALAHLASPTSPCTVKVDTSTNTLTITIKYNKDDKCIKTLITLKSDTNLSALGLKPGTKCTVEVAPAPNHLTIKYKNTTKEAALPKSAALDKPADKIPEGMTAITENISQKIKETATENTYYNIPYHKTKIRYYFTLKNKLDGTKPIKETAAKIIVQYGHIFAE